MKKILLFLMVLAGAAYARPGGGHSFSGGHSYSSHSYSHSYSGGHYSSGHYHGGVGDPAALVVMLVLVFVVAVIVQIIKQRGEMVYTSGPVSPLAATPQVRKDLFNLRSDDPDFSRAVFEDFAYRLYAEARRFGGARVARYFAPGALAKLTDPAEQVVIGTLRVVGSRVVAAENQLIVHYEANLTRGKRTQYVVERWYFYRAHGVRTKPPQTRAWPCPNCGAPWEGGDPTRCASCGQEITPGRFDWAVSDMAIESIESVGKTLTGTVDEVGNNYPTVADAAASARLRALESDDAGVTWQAFQERATMIYGRLNSAWNASDLAPVRGLVTRSLLDYLRYWLDEYKRQGLHNRLEKAELQNLELAKVDRDRYFDAITVRIRATGLDYTVNEGGKVVGGSDKRPRPYSEYWTFLRSSARRGPIVTDPRCPNCGAPLEISDAGSCTHCDAELERGSFDWVLSKIEQDDVYAG
jgi:hypothetical protein